MHVIIPLAGPDFIHADGSIKPLIRFQGQPLLKYALESRPWASRAKYHSFVLHDCEESRQFAHDYLRIWFETCSIVYLSEFSRGAAISALAGLSLQNEFCQPLIIDLADILYKSSIDIDRAFYSDPGVGGIALAFASNNPQYSYLAIDGDGLVIAAAEKKVISDQASAGTYIFRDSAIFLKSIAHAFENESSQTHNNLFYVCPLFNGVIAQGKQVILANAFDIADIKLT